jgi:hypothetical protein
MRRKLIAAVPLAAASAVSALLLAPAVANAAPPTNTTLKLENYVDSGSTSGPFHATGKTICASGMWARVGSTGITLTCSNGGTISLTFGEGTHNGQLDEFLNATAPGATGMLWFGNNKGSGDTSSWSGTLT